MNRIKRIFVLTLVVMTFGAFIVERLQSSVVRAKVFGGPPLAFTAAPGEGVCTGCHYTYGNPNAPGSGGSVVLSGLPQNYEQGHTYLLSVTVAHPTARRWGFELTAIGDDGSSANVGNLDVIDTVRTIRRVGDASGFVRTYISHYSEENRPPSEDGTYPGKTGSNTWTFNWTAPPTNAGSIRFFVAGNAADNGVTPEYDFIYTNSVTVQGTNRAPVFAALPNRIAAPGDRISFVVSASDPDGNQLSYSAGPLPNATFDPVQRVFSFAPSSDQIGAHSITFTVSDGQLSSERVVEILVQNESNTSLTSLTKSPSAGNQYLDFAGATALTLTASGEFGAASKLVFNGLVLDSQALQNGISAQVPAGELALPGIFPVRVRSGDGQLTHGRTFVLARSLNAGAATMVDASAFQPLLAPGQIGALFGANLIVGDQPEAAHTVPLPSYLKSTRVFIDGLPSPFFYVSGGQINLQIPRETSAGTAYVVVYRDDAIASYGTFEVSSNVPSLFSVNGTGADQGSILNQDFSLNGDPVVIPLSRKAKRGEVIIIFGNRPTSNLVSASSGQPASVEDGAGSPFNPILLTTEAATVQLGGKSYPASFSGLSPGFVALWQINFQIPEDAPAGPAQELQVRIGNRLSNRVTVAIE